MKYISFQVESMDRINNKIASAAREETKRRVENGLPVFFLKESKGLTWINMTAIVPYQHMRDFDEIDEAIAFMDAVGIDDYDRDEIYWYEIGRDLFIFELNDSSRRDYVYDINDFLWDLNLRYEYKDRRWSEKMIEGSGIIDFEKAEESISRAVTHIPGSKPLAEELARIVESSNKDAGLYEHPVHYVIESDSEKTRKEVAELLIRTLTDAYRLLMNRSMKYVLRPFENSQNEWESDIEQLYDEYTGGAVVIDGTDKDTLAYLLEDGSVLGRTISEHKEDTLTIILFPSESEYLKEILAPDIVDCKFIPLLQTTLTGQDVKDYINANFGNDKTMTDDRVLERFNENNYYAISYVEEVIKNIRSGTGMPKKYSKLNNDAFLDYKSTDLKNTPAEGKLFDLVGLSSVLEETRNIINRIKTEEHLKARGLNVETGPMNFVFTGSPGVAKTTVAHLLAKELYNEGIVSSDQVIEAGRKNIIGRYEGETSSNVRNAFRKAHGKVLFIDEAYSLMEWWGGRTSGYGKEAIDVIVEELGRPRSDRVVIMAGYPKEMQELLDSNPGLKSRMNYRIDFPDYSTEELLDILEYQARLKGMSIEKGARKKLDRYFEKAKDEKNFGNGRFVVNILDKAINRQRARLANSGLEKIDSMTDEEIRQLRFEDFSDISDEIESLKDATSGKTKVSFPGTC